MLIESKIMTFFIISIPINIKKKINMQLRIDRNYLIPLILSHFLNENYRISPLIDRRNYSYLQFLYYKN